jgi:hypothetical protein
MPGAGSAEVDRDGAGCVPPTLAIVAVAGRPPSNRAKQNGHELGAAPPVTGTGSGRRQ